MQQHANLTRSRIRQLTDRVFARVYPETCPADALTISPQVDRIGYDEAQGLTYRPAKIGESLGPVWATYWVRVTATVPAAWAGQRVDLQWNSRSEATLWVGGRSVQGLNFEAPGWNGNAVRNDAILLERAKGGERLEFQVEVACNRMFGGGGSDSYRTVSPFILEQCDLARFDQEAWDLFCDLDVLVSLEHEQTKDLDKAWGGKLLEELNRFANQFDLDDRATWAPARAILTRLLACRNGTVAHEVSAIGHAHIDTAWLWPIGETWRKCMRTFSTQCTYMDQYPEHRFSCSQAVQYHEMKRRNPDLYARMKARVASGQFIPVGGTWVEPDCNLPSGESLARQFLFGQRFFRQEFGITCREFWNPDVFGYNGQLPQLMRLAGITRFLTQKLSWNQFTKPVHHTFTWEGIDGSRVLAHFPPTDTYNAEATISQLRHGEKNYKDNDRSRHSMLLFGFGDGGGGPVKRMLENLRRVGDLEGVPRTRLRSSDEFFTLLEQECTDLPTMVGELYFELHRGTYTTQGATKRGNRLGEFALHDVEFLAAVAHRLGTAAYPADELAHCWRLLLVNQFHDIIPGSSITLVYQDTARDHQEILGTAAALRARAIGALAGAGEAPLNTTAFARREIAAKPDGTLVEVAAPSYGVGTVVAASDRVAVTRLANGGVRLENAHLRADLAADGSVTSLVEKGSGREALAGPGNVLAIFDDKPTSWNAWDVDVFHLETRKDCPPASAMTVSELPGTDGSMLRAEVAFERTLGVKSRARQRVRLDAGARRLEFHTEVDWQENQRFLKVLFPVQVRALNATYEMQFGAVERPTHFNTLADLAKFEVPGHKWADLSEHGFGVALLTDCKYGYSVHQNLMAISLLRAPTDPDPVADRGTHVFAYAVMPHQGDWRQGRVVREGYCFNLPVQWAGGQGAPRSFFAVEDRVAGAENLVLDTVKKAEDSAALVVRLYECHGGRGVARLKLGLPFTTATVVNLLEEGEQTLPIRDGAVEIAYTPYQIISLKLG